MQINITSIQIIKGMGPDKVSLFTDLPCPFHPDSKLTQDLDLQFDTSSDMAEEYVAKHFPGIPVEVVERTKSQHKFGNKNRSP